MKATKWARERFTYKAFKKGDFKAPHKAILLLIAVVRALHGEDRLTHYSDLDAEFQRLWRLFGSGSGTSTHYPFWYLRNDVKGRLWEVPHSEALLSLLGDRKRKKDVPHRLLVESPLAMAGFPQELHEQLVRFRRRTVENVAPYLLEQSFPASMHSEVLDALCPSCWDAGVPRWDGPGMAGGVCTIVQPSCSGGAS